MTAANIGTTSSDLPLETCAKVEKIAVDAQRTLGANDKVTAFTRGLALSLAVTFNGGHLTRRENKNGSLFTGEVADLRNLKGDDRIHVTKAYKGNCVEESKNMKLSKLLLSNPNKFKCVLNSITNNPVITYEGKEIRNLMPLRHNQHNAFILSMLTMELNRRGHFDSKVQIQSLDRQPLLNALTMIKNESKGFDIADQLVNDVILCRSSSPKEFASLQAQSYDPILDRFNSKYGTNIKARHHILPDNAETQQYSDAIERTA
ncbi:hypothetical protein GJ496_008796 [Pomphorhynchus laevis]|nr:hypothetical protein GJ496_008796 [Pomphorhynchus laevis]